MSVLIQMRRAFRLARIGLHIMNGIVCGLLVFPVAGLSLRLYLQQRWSRQLLEIMAVNLQVPTLPMHSGMVISNHVSWLDVFVISAIWPATFVCKSEVRHWPLIGLLCANSNTLFLERGSRIAAKRIGEELTDKILGGERVALFPEGTTSEGAGLLPFRGALLQAAIDAECTVQPLAIGYRDSVGQPTTVAAYCGGTTFWQSLCLVTAASELSAHVDVLDVLETDEVSRRELAQTAHTLISRALQQNLVDADKLKPVQDPREESAQETGLLPLARVKV
jgi:1-acyl-sn-glycerol-3-phosphate acyltransferase